MFQMYLISIVVWMIVLFLMVQILGPSIIKNGWINSSNSKNTNGSLMFILVAATPILRLLVGACFVLMASMTPEEYEKWLKGNWDDN